LINEKKHEEKNIPTAQTTGRFNGLKKRQTAVGTGREQYCK